MFKFIPLLVVAGALFSGCTPNNAPSDTDTGTKDPLGTYDPAPHGAGNLKQYPDREKGLGKLWPSGPESIPAAAIITVIHFEFDRYDISAGERAKLDAVLGKLKGKKQIFAGYSDRFGTGEYNLGLSDKRANTVKAYLEAKGAGAGDIRAFGSQYAKPAGSKEAVADDRKVIVVDPTKL